MSGKGAKRGGGTSAMGLADRRARLLLRLPLLLMGAAILWDWTVHLYHTTTYDLGLFIYAGQRLVDGHLQWTAEFEENKLLIVQLLFYLPAMLGSVKAWQLMSMASALGGAYAVHCLVRGLLSPARGFPQALGHEAGLYAGALMLFLVSCYPIDQINPMAVSLAMMAAALCWHGCRQTGMTGRAVAAFLASCFCASVALGIRPHLVFFVGATPAWALMSAQLEQGRGIGWLAAVRFCLAWNALTLLFLLAVNLLPYVLAGELPAFFAGIAMLGMEWRAQSLAEALWTQAASMLTKDALQTLAFLLCGGLAAVLARRREALLGAHAGARAAAFDLWALAVCAPLGIQALMVARHFWPHYLQLLHPFIALGAASLAALLLWRHAKPRHAELLWRHKWLFVFALALVCGPLSGLSTRLRDREAQAAELRLASLREVMAEQGLRGAGFLAPYAMQPHVALRQGRHGFPNVILTRCILDGSCGPSFPSHYDWPRSAAEYCQALDERGPALIIFFEDRPLAQCPLRNYALHAPSAATTPAVQSYFLRQTP